MPGAGRGGVVRVSEGGALAAGAGFALRLWRVPALILGAVLSCIATLALATLPAPTAPSTRPLTVRHDLRSHSVTRLPVSLAAAASANIGASERSFWPVRHGFSLLAEGGGIHGAFTTSGARVRVIQGTLGLSLAAVGRGQRLERVAAVAPQGAANQILYRHGSIGEFYRNGPYGLEQGFNLLKRPQAGTGSLVLALGLTGSLTPEQVGSEVLFRTHSGATALRYGQLSAFDATGHRLPAHMQLRDGTLQLQIDDSNARYPLRIDPFIQLGSKLTGGGEIGKGSFGSSVALLAFTPEAPQSPTVTSISPTSGATLGGTLVTIKGSGFLAPATVNIGSEATEVNVVSPEEITAKTAATAAGPYEVVVTDSNGTSTGGSSYAYVAYGVLAWGKNASGQLGNHSTINGEVPVEVKEPSGAPLQGVTAISAGGEHSLARLSSGGRVMAWGKNANGQLGNHSTINGEVPVEVKEPSGAPLQGVTAISAGGEHSLARLSSGGRVMAWGKNANGQLGNHSTINSEVPVEVKEPSGAPLQGVTAISAGGEHSLALLSNGRVMAWGKNANGQLGNHSTINSEVPVEVKEPSGAPLQGVTAISAGGEHSLALLSSGGRVMAWGKNASGQLGNHSTINSEVAVEVRELGGVTAISAGGEHSLARLSNGKVMAWGKNATGQLGNGSTTNSSMAVEVKELSGLTVMAISAGGNHSLARLSSGKVMAWGENADGQLGNGKTENSDMPVEVSALSGITAISAGGSHSLAYAPPPPPSVTSISPTSGSTLGKTLVTIKGNGFLAPATVNIGSATTEVNVVSPTEITAKTAATAAGPYEVVVTDSNGTSTGGPSYTYVPPPTVTSISPTSGATLGGTLVTIKGSGFLAPATVNIGSEATEVNVVSPEEITAKTAATAAGPYEVVVTDSNGTSTGGSSYAYVAYGVLAWGKNASGQLGNHSTINGEVPVEVKEPSGAPLQGVTAISAGGEHSLARLSSGGRVMAWGKNANGQLGNHSTINGEVPVEVKEPSGAPLQGVTAISAGGEHSLARLSSGGRVMAWGKNANGQLGNHSTINSEVPVEVKEPSGAPLQGVTAISAGGEHSLALLSNGRVMAWGKNANGQLGNHSTINSEVPVEVKEPSGAPLQGVTAISAGGEHSLALLSSGGRVMAWGKNASGQLGNHSTINSEVAVEVRELGGVTAISAGGEHSLARLSNGKVMAWGKNATGQLGNGSTTNSSMAVEVKELSGLTVMAISAGGNHSLARLSSGKVMAWGENADGQLGNGKTENSDMPVEVSALSGITAISAGGSHSLAYAPPPPPSVTSISPTSGSTLGKTLVTIKGNGFLAPATVNIGSATTEVNVVSPTEITAKTAATAAGPYEVVVTDSNGTSTGGPSYTYVPPPTVTSISPTSGATLGGTLVTIKGSGFLAPATVNIGSEATEVNVVSPEEITAKTAATAAGPYEVVVTDSNGTSTGGSSYAYVAYGVLAWGKNASGQLGNHSTINGEVPVEVKEPSGAPLQGVTAISAGGEHSLARLSSGGRVMAWGKNANGQLGNHSTINSEVPVEVKEPSGAPLQGVTAISAGGEHSLALLSNGRVMAWGKNASGQLGNHSTINSEVPVEVKEPSGAPLQGVTAISAGGEHSLALLSSGGRVMAWGKNANGQLGNHSTINSEVPVEVKEPSGAPLQGVTAISAGGEHSLALLSSGGRVMAWGKNASGQLGNHSTINSEVAVEVREGLGGVTAISAGGEHSLARLSNGKVMAWGKNATGQLGNGSTTNSSMAVEVKELSGLTVMAISAGGNHSLARLSSGKVMAWGENADGQLGNGKTENSDMPVEVSALSGITAISAGGSHSLAYAPPPPPSVTSISPTSGSTLGKTLVTIKGNGFLAPATVNIGSATTEVNVVSPTEITAKTAATAAGPYEVVVTDSNGTSTGGPSYTYVAPKVTSISPTQGATVGGTLVTIKGSGFLAPATVNIGSEATEVNVVSPEEITAKTAATAAGPYEVVVTDSNGTSTGGPSYTYVAPKVTSISPTQGATVGGTLVTITGSGFVAPATVKIGSESPEVKVLSPTEITALVEATPAGPYEVVVGDEYGTSHGGPSFFFADPPTTVTEAASAVTQTSATLNGTVNPNYGELESCEFEYGTTGYGSRATCTPYPQRGASLVAVSAPLTSLTANTTYHFRLRAQNVNVSKTEFGKDQTFTTLPNPPTVVTGVASLVTQTSATLNATVNPNGHTITNCHFEYGGATIPCESLPGSGSSPVAVSASVGGLSPNVTYFFRIVATSVEGTNEGSNEALKTLPNSPTVLTKPASSVAFTSATLNATVNPNGGEVSECRFEYDIPPSYGKSAPCTPSPGSGTLPITVSASVTDLTANTTYHFRISAANAGGTSKGSDETFTTPKSPKYEVGHSSTPIEKVPYISWGTLALTNSLGGTSVSCENAVIGWVEKGGNKEETNGWTAYNCKDEECEAAGGKVGVIFENENSAQSNPVRLEWPGELVGAAPNIRLKSTNVKVYVHCQFAALPSTEKPGVGPFTGLEERSSVEFNAPGAVSCSAGAGGGTSTPKTVNSSRPLASKLTFTGGAGGELACSNGGKGITTGSLKTLGYSEMEEISTANA